MIRTNDNGPGFRKQVDSPDWRWQAALQLANGDTVSRDPDSLVLEAAKRLCGEPATVDDPMEASIQIWKCPTRRAALQIMTLADLSTEEIAEQLAVTPRVVEGVEGLYFDVRPHLQATGWIHRQVIAPIGANNAILGVKLSAAFHGGPAVARAFLALDDDAVLLDAAKRISNEQTLLHVRFRQAMAEPLDNAQSTLTYLRLFFDYRIREQRLELARQRFVHKCVIEKQRCEASRHRVEVAEQRDSRKELRRRRRAEERRQEKELWAAVERERAALLQERQQRAEWVAADRLAASPLAQLTFDQTRPQIQRRVA